MVLPQEVVQYLTGNFPFSVELQCFFMALQGAMKVREGANRDRRMAWFHAFCLSVVLGYGGGLFTPLWMGLPTPMLGNDLCVFSCIVAFILVNYMPGDIGYRVGRTFPIVVVTTVFAQLFRILGLLKYVDVAYEAFKDNPSAYYPIPVVGPIAYGTILGNMGSFFVLGFHGYLKNGMPWPFQNGLFCASFYHFFANDAAGVIGMQLRQVVNSAPIDIRMGLSDDRKFAAVFVSIFMHVMCILQLPQFLGPSFSPFNSILAVMQPVAKSGSLAKSAGVSDNVAKTPSKSKSKKKKTS